MNPVHDGAADAPRAQPRLALLEVIGRDGRVAQTLDVRHWPLTLGRSLAADLVIDDPHVAPLHATLREVDGVLTLEVGDTTNGVRQAGELHARGARVPVPAGGTTWQIGGLTLRLRTPAEALAAEQPLPPQATRQAWPVLGMAVALAVLALANHWLGLDPGSELVADWLPLVAGLPLLLGLWAGLWALASKLFQHRFEFMAHLRLALPVALGIEALDSFVPPLAAALDLPLLWRLVGPLQIAALLWLLYRHLSLVLPQARRAVAVFVGAAALAGSAVAVSATWRSVDRWSHAPYMSTLPMPATLWRPAEPADALAADLGPLAEQLARRVQKALDEEPPEDAGDDQE